MVFNKDRNYGYERHSFGHSERFTRTDMKCPPPCELIKYNLEYGPSLVGDFAGIMMKSIEIGFPDFMIKNKKEYRQCDSTCIIGQLGGNLGFFLGGSILAGLDLILDGIVMLYRRLFMNQKNSPAETNWTLRGLNCAFLHRKANVNKTERIVLLLLSLHVLKRLK